MIKLSQPRLPESAIARVGDVLRSGQLVHGEECIAFEKELADFLGAKHVLVVSNGTAALHLALLSLNIGPGDAVIVPDFTFAATANIVEISGAKALIVDVEASSYNLDPVKLEECILNWKGPESLKAIMPVLEFGNPSNLNRYRAIADKYNLALIEDAACALGAKAGLNMVGTIGDFGCFSFHPRKTLTTGEGGALVTNSSQLYKKASLYRNHGMVKVGSKVSFEQIGLNYRLTNFQAAIGREALPYLGDWISKRKHLFEYYQCLLKPLCESGKVTLPQNCYGHSYQTYMILISDRYDRDTVILDLYRKGIESTIGAQSMSELGLYDLECNKNSKLDIGPILYKHGLALPLHENMTQQDVEFVIKSIELSLS